MEEQSKIWIALSGKAGCGKSTIADALVKDYGFIRLSFAKRLKELCDELFPELMNQDKNSARWVLQKFGTDYCRRIKNNVWVDIVRKQIEHYEKHYDLYGKKIPRIVVDDVRFFNEWWALKSRGFKMVRIHRANHLREKFGYDVKDRHASETQLDVIKPESWDLWVANNDKYPFNLAVDYIVRSFDIK